MPEDKKPQHPEIDWKNLALYKDAGFSLTPLVGPFDETYPEDQRGKRPIHNDWNKRAYSGIEITPARFKGHNAGWVIPENVVVADIDPRNFKDGVNSVDKLRENTGIDLFEEATVIIETGGGGYHLPFKKPRKMRVVNELKEYPGIEFKTVGRQVVTVGSTHASGKIYDLRWDSLGFKDIKKAPQKLLDLIARKENVVLTGNKSAKMKDTASVVKKGQELLKLQGPAVEGGGGDNKTYKLACTLRDYGLTPEKTLELMCAWNETCSPPWNVNDLQEKINNAYNYAQSQVGCKTAIAEFEYENPTDNSHSSQPVELTPEAAAEQEKDLINWEDSLNQTAQGGIKTNFHNTVLHLRNLDRLRGIIAYDEFTHNIVLLEPAPWQTEAQFKKLEVGGVPWTDNDDVHCKAYLNRCDFDPNTNTIREALIETASHNKFHPVRDYFNSLQWDGVSRLDTWLTKFCGADDNPYTRAVARKTLVAIVTRIFNPGTKFDQLTILEGKQGAGKSTIWRMLCRFRTWFIDETPNFHNKDYVVQMLGKMIWEIAELAGFNRTDVNVAKSVISREVDNIRLPYGRRSEIIPRQCTLVGSSNKTQLIDETGNRRYWVVRTGDVIDFRGFDLIVDQLWAEAVVVARTGKELLFLDNPQAIEIAEQEQEDRFIGDDWAETIDNFLQGTSEFDTEAQPLEQVTGTQIWAGCLGRTPATFDRKAQCRISDVMQRLGWLRRSIRVDGKVVKGYVKPGSE
jgi:predicted P-loop ATPase